MKFDISSLLILPSLFLTTLANSKCEDESTNVKHRYINLFSFSPGPPAKDTLAYKLPCLRRCLTSAGVSPKAIVQQDSNLKIYRMVNHQWNEYPETKKPTAYLVVRTVADIQAAVRCGRQFNVRVVPKGGGHSFEKYSFGDANSLVLDLELLDSVSMDHATGTADVGPGVLLGPLAWKLYANGSEYGIPSGLCPSVGISLALGGGFGNLPRYYGLTTDVILELDLITADGELQTVNKDTNPDLFWALRGGGGSASFGIVTRFKFELQKAPAHIVYSLTFYKHSQFATVFRTWQELLADGNLPNTINSVLMVNQTHVTLEFVEVHPKRLATPKNSLIPHLLKKFPTVDILGQASKATTYPEFLLQTVFPAPELYNLTHPADLLKIHRGTFTAGFGKSKSYFSGPHALTSDDTLCQLVAALGAMPEGSNSLVLEAFGAGSVINAIAPNATAFVHRDSLYHATVGYTGDRYDYETKGKQKLLDFYNLVTRLLNHSESYQNYADADLENPLEKYYGTNLERLVAIKRVVDPDNYFHSPESIPPTL